MITTILSDLARVILNPKDKTYTGTLNALNVDLLKQYGSYDFFKYFEFNEELLSFYERLKNRYSLNIFTSGTIQDNVEVQKRINPMFENVYSAEYYNILKEDPEAYIFIAKKLNKEQEEIIFIDDYRENVDAAMIAGMNGIVYKDTATLIRDLKKYIP